MNSRNISFLLSFLGLCFGAVSCSTSQSSAKLFPATPLSLKVESLGVKHLKQVEVNRFASGQPTQEQLKALSAVGVTNVINLCPSSEINWDEKQTLKSLGMKYYHIPVGSEADLTKVNVKAYTKALEASSGGMTLVHCSSTNRVGAMTALKAGWIDGMSQKEAVLKGKQWGMSKSGLIKKVEQKLSENKR